MRIVISFLLALAALSSYGQKIRFTDPGNRWVVAKRTPGGSYQSAYTFDSTDTVIHGKVYKRLYGDFVREDTVNSYVYYFDRLLDTERVLYNYNMLPGDTITFYASVGILKDSVVSVDSIFIDGNKYRIINILGNWRNYTVVEGIGTTNGPMHPARFYCFEAIHKLSCFSRDSIYPTFTAPCNTCFYGPGTFVNDSFCRPDYLSINTPHGSKDAAMIRPNPASDIIYLKLGEPAILKPLLISVYDLFGNRVHTRSINGPKTDYEIPVATWPPGLYTFVIQGFDWGSVIKKVAIAR